MNGKNERGVVGAMGIVHLRKQNNRMVWKRNGVGTSNRSKIDDGNYSDMSFGSEVEEQLVVLRLI